MLTDFKAYNFDHEIRWNNPLREEKVAAFNLLYSWLVKLFTPTKHRRPQHFSEIWQQQGGHQLGRLNGRMDLKVRMLISRITET